MESGIERLIGKTATVLERVDPQTQSGRVKIYGEAWQTFAATHPIEVGKPVQILEFQGNRVRVEEVFDLETEIEHDFEKRLYSKD